MYDLATMFLHCLNHWKLETPTARKQLAQNEEFSVYKTNYTRYIIDTMIVICINYTNLFNYIFIQYFVNNPVVFLS